MKGQEEEMDQLRQLVVALVAREGEGCASGSGEEIVDKVGGGDERDAREEGDRT